MFLTNKPENFGEKNYEFCGSYEATRCRYSDPNWLYKMVENKSGTLDFTPDELRVNMGNGKEFWVQGGEYLLRYCKANEVQVAIYVFKTRDRSEVNKLKEAANAVLHLDKNTTSMNQIQGQLKFISDDIFNERIYVESNGADDYIVRKCVGYFENEGRIVSWGNK